MDFDIEMDDAAQQEQLMEELPQADDILQPDGPEELGEVIETDGDQLTGVDAESRTIVPSKIHIRGLDSLHTNDIKAYVQAHFGNVDRVEWIDDTSANLLFPSELAARDALLALTTVEISDPSALDVGETLPAKPFADRPDAHLQVRFALQSDKKQVGAALRSRYYLLHPEHDPEERRRRHRDDHRDNRDHRGRYRERDGWDDDRRHRRRASDDGRDDVPFEASMYDDVPRASRPARHSDGDDRRDRTRDNKGKELFAGYRQGRDRSASPQRDRDEDEDMDGKGRPSSRGNRANARSIKERLAPTSGSKELFPTKISSGRGGNLDVLERAIGSAHLKEEDLPKVVDVPTNTTGSSFNIRGAAHQRGDAAGFSIKGSAANAKELFPTKLGGSNAGKELLGGNKRPTRQRAEDLFG